MKSQKITIGVTIYQIDNLLTTLDTSSWETNPLTSKELGALYKLNSDYSVVKKKLEDAYNLLLSNFLSNIKPVLQVLQVVGSTYCGHDSWNKLVNWWLKNNFFQKPFSRNDSQD